MFYVLLPKMLFLFRYPDAFFPYGTPISPRPGWWTMGLGDVPLGGSEGHPGCWVVGMGKCWPLDKQWAVFNLIKPSGGRLGGWVDQP